MRTTFAALAVLMIAVSPAAAQAPLTFMETQTNSEVLGTDFFGTPVNGKDGQQIGKVANLVFDQHGRIELLIIGIGGYMGVGEKDVAVPFEAVKPDVAAGKRVFVIDATKDQLKAAPTYKTLNEQALAERMKVWREKAQASWTDIKGRTSKAYEEAKEKAEDVKDRASKAYEAATKEKAEDAAKPKQ
jgi:sporulation protein YlmC with PRC-barrel domain